LHKFVPWHPPEAVIDDLLARDIQRALIGHMALSDARLWALADEVDEALLTLAKRRYLNDRYDQWAFKEVLHAYPTHEWMLSSLVMLKPSHIEKAVILIEYIHKAPNQHELTNHQSETFGRL